MIRRGLTTLLLLTLLLTLLLAGCRQQPAAPAVTGPAEAGPTTTGGATPADPGQGNRAAGPAPAGDAPGLGLPALPGAPGQPNAPGPADAPAPPAPGVTPRPAPERLDLQPTDVPAGYAPVAAVGDSLILRQLGDTPTERLVRFAGGQLAQTIAERPANRFLAFGADDRYLVWSESEADVDASQNDHWRIWAWDSRSGESFLVARYAATAAAIGLPANIDIGPLVKVSAGRFLWSSFDPTAAGPALQLHLYDLGARQDTILATAQASAPLGSYDIHGQRIAYVLGDQLILRESGQQSIAATASRLGQVVLTDDALLWTEGPATLRMQTAAGDRTLPDADDVRLLYSSGDHFVTWYSASDDNLYLLHTPDGKQYLAATGTIQGGAIIGGYVTWGVRDATSHPPRTRAARLPVLP